MNILHVEDVRSAAASFASAFQDHRVTTVPTAAEGLKAIRKNHFDLIVMDWGLPDATDSTWKVLQLLANPPHNKKRTPLVVLTANKEKLAQCEGSTCKDPSGLFVFERALDFAAIRQFIARLANQEPTLSAN